jgi:tagatose 1,6-diphosphate aldolase
MPMKPEADFLDPGELIDGELRLRLVQTGVKGPTEPGLQFPFYRFDMFHAADGQRMGSITLRIGDADGILKFPGHIGFDVEPKYRGRRYAERSTRLLFPLARRHGLKELWIGCSVDNEASKRTCEKLGGTLVEVATVPEGMDLYEQGIRRLNRYRIRLE